MSIEDLAQDLSDLSSCLFDASIQSTISIASNHFELTSFPEKFQRYIQNYVDHKRNASQCYIDYLFDNHYLSSEVRLL